MKLQQTVLAAILAVLATFVATSIPAQTLTVWSVNQPADPAPDPVTVDPPADPAPGPAAQEAGKTPTPELADSPVTENLFGASLVIDPAHIAKTLQVIQNGIETLNSLQDQYNKLTDLERIGDLNLERFTSTPFVDDQNFTGAFLEKMLWVMAGGHPLYEVVEEDALSFSRVEVSDLFTRHFPGAAILPLEVTGVTGQPSPWDEFDSPAALYDARYAGALAALKREFYLLNQHTFQRSRERQGIHSLRNSTDFAEGSNQHDQLMIAALHQMIDAQSVDRQLKMLGLNTQLLATAEEFTQRAESLALNQSYLEQQADLFRELARPSTEVEGEHLVP